jgi:hypothetical protein
MLWGIQELPKILLGSAMAYNTTPCERSPLKQPYGRFKETACRASRLFITPLDTPCHTGLVVRMLKSRSWLVQQSMT